jgi:LAS superfamily LD-carboxypeptidase LdcB
MVPATHDAASSGREARGIPTALPGEGAVGRGGTVFDESSATVAKLDPALLDALRAAATEARAQGVELHVNSGWRSAAEQERLLEQAVAEYGSEKEARRWVATPETSAHASGDAVDLGPTAAARWLAQHGAAYGLCRVYRNEPWHFELRQGAALSGCPALYADPTQDPRMSR